MISLMGIRSCSYFAKFWIVAVNFIFKVGRASGNMFRGSTDYEQFEGFTVSQAAEVSYRQWNVTQSVSVIAKLSSV